jgi:hypothetical protein
MTDIKIKADQNGEADAPSVTAVNRKLEAFVEVLVAKFQEQHDRIRNLEQQVKELKAKLNGKV